MKFADKNSEMALSYEAYARYSENLLHLISNDANNPMNGYARTNLQILQRLKRSVSLADELQAAIRQSPGMIFVILTEGYCGDSAQTFPIFGRMQEKFPEKIDIKVVLRDEHPEIAKTFFRTRAIPMLICLDKQTLTEKFIWGSRPAPAQQMMDSLKIKGATQAEKSVALHRWYAQDKTITLQKELTELLKR
jgi:hypothetical protein